MISKRGAIQLSMSTIIVVILGVILLILGLAFVRGIFAKTDILTDNAFDEAEKSLKNMGKITQTLTVSPSTMALDQGTSKGGAVVVKNMDTITHQYQIKVTIPDKTKTNSNIDCLIGETESYQTDIFSLESGKERDFTLVIGDKAESPLDTFTCVVHIFEDNAEIDSEAVLINIK